MLNHNRAKTTVKSNATSFAANTPTPPTIGLPPAPPTRQTSAPLKSLNAQAHNRSAREMARMLDDDLITVDAPYQRGSVWSGEQRENMVKSWLSGLPVPAIILGERQIRADGTGPLYAVIDGKQRLETAHAWFFGDLAVPASWFEAHLVETTTDTDDGPYTTYAGLTEIGRRLIANRAMLPALEVRAASIAEEAEMFDLVNTGGTPQTDEDLERARDIAGS